MSPLARNSTAPLILHPATTNETKASTTPTRHKRLFTPASMPGHAQPFFKSAFMFNRSFTSNTLPFLAFSRDGTKQTGFCLSTRLRFSGRSPETSRALRFLRERVIKLQTLGVQFADVFEGSADGVVAVFRIVKADPPGQPIKASTLDRVATNGADASRQELAVPRLTARYAVAPARYRLRTVLRPVLTSGMAQAHGCSGLGSDSGSSQSSSLSALPLFDLPLDDPIPFEGPPSPKELLSPIDLLSPEDPLSLEGSLPLEGLGLGTDKKATAKTISEETISTLRSRRASWQSRWMSRVIFGWVSISYLAEVASSTYLWTSLGFSTSKESLSSGSMSPEKFQPTGWHEEYSFPPPDVIVGGTRSNQKNTANAAKATTLRVIR